MDETPMGATMATALVLGEAVTMGAAVNLPAGKVSAVVIGVLGVGGAPVVKMPAAATPSFVSTALASDAMASSPSITRSVPSGYG
jgi:hypothetical protein